MILVFLLMVGGWLLNSHRWEHVQLTETESLRSYGTRADEAEVAGG